jgi:hypothetical protein
MSFTMQNQSFKTKFPELWSGHVLIRRCKLCERKFAAENSDVSFCQNCDDDALPIYFGKRQNSLFNSDERAA